MPHILVVEDEAHLAIGIKYNLEAEGFTVTTVGDGQSALASLLAAARVAGRTDEQHVRLADGTREFRVSVSLFREDKASYLLLPVVPAK